jgi:hypothetical protein
MTENDYYTQPHPIKLPKRVDGQPQKSPVNVDALDAELVDMYVAEGIPERIVTAFLAFDLEPPKVGDHGFSMRQGKILDATAYDAKPGFWEEQDS